MYSLKVGKSITLRHANFYDNVKDLIEAGFDTIDADLCEGGFFYGEEDKQNVCNRLQYIKDSGLELNGVHLPYGGSRDIANLDDAVRNEAIKQHLEMMKAADAYSPRCYIIHGSWEPVPDNEREEGLRRMAEALNYMQKQTNTPIAVESLPRACLLNTAAEMVKAAAMLDKPYFCLDVNHFLQEKTETVIPKIAKWVITTHISDHDYENERHWLPGKGKIDWVKVIEELDKAGYQGVWNYEVRDDEYDTFKDLKANFDNLFAQYNAKK